MVFDVGGGVMCWGSNLLGFEHPWCAGDWVEDPLSLWLHLRGEHYQLVVMGEAVTMSEVFPDKKQQRRVVRRWLGISFCIHMVGCCSSLHQVRCCYGGGWVCVFVH